LRVLLAGGGTAGHVNPLLATAAALRDPATGGDERAELLVLGTKEGLEDRLVPEAGYDLAYVPRVPMPRRPTGDLFLLPRRLQKAVIASREAIERVGAQVVVGFGGFVSTPAYLAARQAGVPVVIHEQNARPGGCLQSFRRDGNTFDTGFHCVGGLRPGEVLHPFFRTLPASSFSRARPC